MSRIGTSMEATKTTQAGSQFDVRLALAPSLAPSLLRKFLANPAYPWSTLCCLSMTLVNPYSISTTLSVVTSSQDDTSITYHSTGRIFRNWRTMSFRWQSLGMKSGEVNDHVPALKFVWKCSCTFKSGCRTVFMHIHAFLHFQSVDWSVSNSEKCSKIWHFFENSPRSFGRCLACVLLSALGALSAALCGLCASVRLSFFFTRSLFHRTIIVRLINITLIDFDWG